jgi:hypothetical protein
MATATYTCSVFAAPAKNVHVGDQSVSGQVLWSAASTVGDIAFLAKVPNNAKIVDFAEFHTTGASAQGLSFGFDRGIAAGGGGNASVLVASGAQGTVGNRMSMANFPITISLSDTDPLKYAILIAKVESGTTTTSLLVAFRLTYRMDGPDPV